MPESIAIVALFVASLGAFALGVMLFTVTGPWVRARMGQAPIGWWRLCGMAMRRLNLGAIVNVYIVAKKAAVDAPLDEIEAHALAGGSINRVMVAAAAARKAEVDFPFRMAAAFDLSCRDVVKTVQDLIHAKETGLRERADEATAEAVAEWVGATAEVVHAVGPPGLVSVGDKLVSAIAVGGYVPKGATVSVIGTKDNMVVVKATAD